VIVRVLPALLLLALAAPAHGQAQPKAVPMPPAPPSAMVGSWTVDYQVTTTTCPEVAPAARSTARWRITAGKTGKLELVETGGAKGDPRTYRESVEPGEMIAGTGATLRSGNGARLDMAIVDQPDGQHLVGSRLHIRGGTCAMFAHVDAVRAYDVPEQLGADDPDKDFTLARALVGLAADQPIIVASFETGVGTIDCELYPDDAPLAVANFVGLARGLRAWRDPKTGKFVRGRPFYDGLAFHRVIPGFMIQAGDPASRDWNVARLGAGDAGYRLADDPPSRRRFDIRGRLAMANAGPGTAGSQFFITEVPAPHLDGRYTIFGVCLPGEVIQRAARVTADPATGRPLEPLRIKKVTVRRQPAPLLE
jgi:peptidyl-prolyl cis-trans isomerase A (cyclophilin A)